MPAAKGVVSTLSQKEREAMSENDPTKDIGAKYDTRPTIETVLDRIQALGEQLDTRMARFEERIEARLDRIESEVKKTGSEFYELRADFRDFKKELREHFPFVK